MASTYVNDLRLNEMATGDQSGSWGTVTNTNLELIAEAFSYSTEAITTNADTHTTTIADGATDPGRSMFLKYTGTLDSTCTITIGPNTVSKLWFIENATSGSQDIIIKQGSGATVTIASGKTKVIYSDGVGSGAKMVDAFAALDVGSVSVDNITIDGNEIDVSSGDLTLDVAGSIYLDSDAGDIFLTDNGTNTIRFNNTNGTLNLKTNTSDADIQFQGNDGGVGITALTLDMSAAGAATFNDAVKLGDGNVLSLGVGNDLEIYSDGTNGQIAAQNGNLTFDVAGDISFDAEGTDIYLKSQGNSWGHFMTTSNNFYINSTITDGDIVFQGVDGGSTITALTLDMSDGGTAIFNSYAKFPDNQRIVMGSGSDLSMYHDGTNSLLVNGTGDFEIRGAGAGVGNILLRPKSGENGVIVKPDSAVELYHNNSKKFETTSSGITVTGTINGGDCRGDIWLMGRDDNDYIAVNPTEINFVLDNTVDMRLDGNADLLVEGNVIAYSTTISDERLKKDIVKIDNALDKVSQLNGYTFEYLADGKKSAGVIAQEVQKVLPSAITESTLSLKMGDDNETKYMTVQYDQLMGLMVEAIKELKAEIEELKAR